MADNTATKKKQVNVCAVCKIAASQICSDCKIVYYCGREHQKIDWKSHSKNCRVFELVNDATLGRHYVAARKIEIDEIVLCEKKPLLSMPSPKNTPSCIKCYTPLTVANGTSCKICGWILCFNCKEHGPECELTIKYRKSKVTVSEYLRRYEDSFLFSIAVLRALDLRQKNRKAYRKLLNLEDGSTRWTERINKMNESTTEMYTRSRMAVSVKKLLKIDDVDEAEITKILEIAGIYGFDIPSSGTKGHTAIFEKASYIAHNCRPNCRFDCYNDSTNEGRIIVRAVTTIPKGETITISYSSVLNGTARRQDILRKNKFFDCTCERCKDPTEFGTMFNAIKCINGRCTGYMLPPTFLVSNGEKIPDFVCNTCNSSIAAATIDKMMSNIAMELSKIPVKNAELLRKFIDKYSKILHENHVHIFSAEYELTFALGPSMIDLMSVPENFMEKYIKLCKKLINLLIKIMPSEHEFRGTLLLNEFIYMNTLTERHLLRKPSETPGMLAESKEIIREAYRLMRYEPEESIAGKMAHIAHLYMEKKPTNKNIGILEIT